MGSRSTSVVRRARWLPGAAPSSAPGSRRRPSPSRSPPSAVDRRAKLSRPMILAIDQGTTGTTCMVFDERAQPLGRAYSEFAQHFPRPGWVEHDAAEIWDVTRRVAHEAIADAGIAGSDL